MATEKPNHAKFKENRELEEYTASSLDKDCKPEFQQKEELVRQLQDDYRGRDDEEMAVIMTYRAAEYELRYFSLLKRTSGLIAAMCKDEETMAGVRKMVKEYTVEEENT